jgi:hypothetical protein
MQEISRKMNSVHSSSRRESRPETRKPLESKSKEAAAATKKWAFEEKECFQINYFQGKERGKNAAEHSFI